jgi:hypothetical protein
MIVTRCSAGVDVMRGQSNQRKHVLGMSGNGGSSYSLSVERESSPGSYGKACNIAMVAKSCLAVGAKLMCVCVCVCARARVRSSVVLTHANAFCFVWFI